MIGTIIEVSGTKIAINGFDRRRCADDTEGRLTATRTEIAGHNFLQIFMKAGPNSSDERPAYFIAYDFDVEGHLTISLPDVDVFERAVDDGELVGSVRDPKDKDGKRLLVEGPDITVTASTPRLRAYLEDHPEAMKASPDAKPTKLDSLPTPLCQK